MRMMTCQKCGAACERTGSARKYCRSCAVEVEKERKKTYSQTPERKAYMKAYRQNPKRKESNEKRRQSSGYKAYMNARRETPEYKAYMKAYKQTPEYKAYQRVYKQEQSRRRKFFTAIAMAGAVNKAVNE